jgi:hypothetical protein
MHKRGSKYHHQHPMHAYVSVYCIRVCVYGSLAIVWEDTRKPQSTRRPGLLFLFPFLFWNFKAFNFESYEKIRRKIAGLSESCIRSVCQISEGNTLYCALNKNYKISETEKSTIVIMFCSLLFTNNEMKIFHFCWVDLKDNIFFFWKFTDWLISILNTSRYLLSIFLMFEFEISEVHKRVST